MWTYSWITCGISDVLVIVTCFSISFAKIRSRFLYLYDLLNKIEIKWSNLNKNFFIYKASYSVLISFGIANNFLVGFVVE